MIKNACKNTQVKENTLSPIWNEMLIIKGLTFYGSLNSVMEIENEVIIEIMSCEKSGKAEFLGRTVATIRQKENLKTPPSLEWFNIISTSSEIEGQLLAAFELIEASHEEEVSDREDDIPYDADRGPVLPIPPSICPQFTKHRIEVLFWGLRELKRVNLKSLQQPRVEVECAGHSVQSSVITNYKNHSNFINVIQKMDMDLPDQEEHFPSFGIKLVECKGFGRLTVVATHIVQSFQKYVYRPFEHEPSLESIDYIALNVDGDNASDNAAAFVVQKIYSPWKKLERSPSEIGGEMEGKDWWSRYYISTGYRLE
ncbi:otoferlin-like, partial [Stegodyphus dumicola]|uniref:otoferlin-like n=1 Tax=Stegodyphus dumicola TaxID=202533 RepID=UPI0015AEFBA1